MYSSSPASASPAKRMRTSFLWARSGLTSTRIRTGLCRILNMTFREDVFLLGSRVNKLSGDAPGFVVWHALRH
jgi:hypothetical protein